MSKVSKDSKILTYHSVFLIDLTKMAFCGLTLKPFFWHASLWVLHRMVNWMRGG